MGRAKLKLELISKEGPRMNTFKKRKECLKKKLKELTTLCDVSACMIIYGPDGKPENYPENLNETCRVIAHFNSKRGESKSFGLSDFLKLKMKEEVAEEKMEVKLKYPTWHETFDSVDDPPVLRNFADELSAKAELVKSRIALLRNQDMGGSSSGSTSTSAITTQQQYYYNGFQEPPYMTQNNLDVDYNGFQQPPYMTTNVHNDLHVDYNGFQQPLYMTTNVQNDLDVDDYLIDEPLFP